MDSKGRTETQEENAWKKKAEIGFLLIRRLFKKPGSVVGFLGVIIVIVGTVMAPWIAPFDPNQVSVGPSLSGPNHIFLLGTDRYGRDIFSRVLYGGRISLPAGIGGVSLATVVGSWIGMLLGFRRGWPDIIGSRFIDILLGIPPIMLALMVIAVLGIGVEKVVLAVGMAAVPRFARVIRGVTMSVSESLYVEAARALGASNGRILARHIVPNIAGTALVLGTLYLGRVVLETSALSFLGLGAQPPAPEWGTMLSESREFMRQAPWMMLGPGGVLFLTVVSVNLLGDGLREILDPRLRVR